MFDRHGVTCLSLGSFRVIGEIQPFPQDGIRHGYIMSSVQETDTADVWTPYKS